ncbi:sodium:solute symporter family transporter [Arhodomonas sp. SL1]|uniref:sodium:solute symporter family transporter n=1 Tax=Arhodomonas sp. SL1 TaxID=3425691 RepID=UPI003F88361C
MSLLTLVVVVAALAVFTWLGVRARYVHGGLDDYVTARNSQGGRVIGLSFLASGMGAWILFAPPEVGAFVGPVALGGYALGSALPFFVLGLWGPAMRRRLPAGRSIGEFAASVYGQGVRRWVAFISALYMLCFLAAELTAIGAITGMLSGIPGWAAVIGVASATLAYTALGGLRASLVTDRWQAWLLLALVALVAGVAVSKAGEGDAGALSLPAVPVADALGVAAALVIAVTAANLFHQGYWQRVWAARDGAALGRGALLGGVTTIVVVAVIGGLGLYAAAAGLPLGEPPVPFFALLAEAPAWLTVPALVLAVTLVASSVDTLQNGLASLLVTEGRGRGLSLAVARGVTVALMIPVVAIALQGISVLRLFLIADLLCATTVVPVFLGLWSRMGPAAAVAGALAGLVGAVIPGWVSTGSVVGGPLAASFPDGVPTLGPFAGALIASALVSLLVAAIAPGRRP